MKLGITHLAKKFAESQGISLKTAKEIIVAVEKLYITSLLAGDEIDIGRKFKLQTVDRAARNYRSPKDGSIVKKPACKALKVKIYPGFKAEL